MLLISRSGVTEEKALELFHHYSVPLFPFLNVKFQVLAKKVVM